MRNGKLKLSLNGGVHWTRVHYISTHNIKSNSIQAYHSIQVVITCYVQKVGTENGFQITIISFSEQKAIKCNVTVRGTVALRENWHKKTHQITQ